MRWLGEAPSDDSLSPLLEGMPTLAETSHYDAIALGVPAAFAPHTQEFVAQVATRFPNCPCLPYRARLGQHASVGATAAAVVARAVLAGALPFAQTPVPLPRKRVLLLQLGRRSAAMEVFA